jgi:uncharacterized RDD family membrane protein YckC
MIGMALPLTWERMIALWERQGACHDLPRAVAPGAILAARRRVLHRRLRHHGGDCRDRPAVITDGRIRVSGTLVNYMTCSHGRALPAGLDVPADFKVTSVVQCTRSFFGLVHDRTVTINEITRSGSVTYTRSMTFPADAEGRPTQAFYLDYLWVFVLAIYRIVLEWRFGATLGKRLLHMRVRPLGGGPMTAAAAIKRTLVCFIPLYPFMLAALPLMILSPTRILALLNHFLVALAVGAVLFIVFGLNFILALRRGDLPWHDRWARTEVVRTMPAAPLGEQSAAAPSGPGTG